MGKVFSGAPRLLVARRGQSAYGCRFVACAVCLAARALSSEKEDRLISREEAETKANELLKQQLPARSGKKLSCPSCGTLSIPAIRKFRIGPLTYIRCPSCKAKISVPWLAVLAVLAVLPFVGAILLASHLPSFWLAATAIVSGFVLYVVLHQLYVPLITKRP